MLPLAETTVDTDECNEGFWDQSADVPASRTTRIERVMKAIGTMRVIRRSYVDCVRKLAGSMNDISKVDDTSLWARWAYRSMSRRAYSITYLHA